MSSRRCIALHTASIGLMLRERVVCERERQCMVFREEVVTPRGRWFCGTSKYSTKSAKLFITEQSSSLLSGLGFGFMEKYE